MITKEELRKLETSMTKEELMEYAKKMGPVMRKDGQLWWIDPCKIHTQSCTYGAKFLEEALSLSPLKTITSYHKYGGYYGFLRPSVDEAIFQCPKDILEQVVAFEFIIPEDLYIWNIYSDVLDRHVLKITYYSGDFPEKFKNRQIEW